VTHFEAWLLRCASKSEDLERIEPQKIEENYCFNLPLLGETNRFSFSCGPR
jgi:hypothetical protein